MDHIVDLYLVLFGADFSGKAEQAMGDGGGPFHMVFDFLDGRLVLIQVFQRGRVFFRQQLLDPACLGQDHLQGVVDLMGDPGCQASDVGHFLDVGHLLVQGCGFPIRLGHMGQR